MTITILALRLPLVSGLEKVGVWVGEGEGILDCKEEQGWCYIYIYIYICICIAKWFFLMVNQ